MRQLIVFRHGEYGAGDRITDQSRVNIQKTAQQLKLELLDEPLIRTSTVPRALETANILHSVLGGRIVEDRELVANYLKNEGYLTKHDLKKYLENVTEEPSPVILVTHIDICALLLEYLKKDFPDLEVLMLARGEAVLFDFESKETHLYRTCS